MTCGTVATALLLLLFITTLSSLLVLVQSRPLGEPELGPATTPATTTTSTSTEFAIGATVAEQVSSSNGSPEVTTPEEDEPEPEDNGRKVSLDIPDELFAASANLTLRLRDVFGEFIMRSAARLAKAMRFIQPLFGSNLVIEIPKDLENV